MRAGRLAFVISLLVGTVVMALFLKLIWDTVWMMAYGAFIAFAVVFTFGYVLSDLGSLDVVEIAFIILTVVLLPITLTVITLMKIAEWLYDGYIIDKVNEMDIYNKLRKRFGDDIVKVRVTKEDSFKWLLVVCVPEEKFDSREFREEVKEYIKENFNLPTETVFSSELDKLAC